MNKKYYLFGIPVTKNFFESDYSKLDPNIILKEKNAQKRMMYIQLIGIVKILEKIPHEVIEEISGLELYHKYPIGDYYQQGDVLVKSDPMNTLKFDDLSEKMKVRLDRISYKLIKFTIMSEEWKYLVLSSASIKGLIHCEGVSGDCDSVFKAICWRNKENSLPFELT